MIKIIMKKDEIRNHLFKFLTEKIMIIGIKIAISTSKIKKIIVIKKKWIENAIRGLEWGSNPHSKGEIFSISFEDFLFKISEIKIIKLEIKTNTVSIIIIR